MSKPFRPYTLNQRLLLPPDLREWLPEGHLALFVSEVGDALDLSARFVGYEQGAGRGQPPYAPALRVARASRPRASLSGPRRRRGPSGC